MYNFLLFFTKQPAAKTNLLKGAERLIVSEFCNGHTGTWQRSVDGVIERRDQKEAV